MQVFNIQVEKEGHPWEKTFELKGVLTFVEF